MFDYLLKKNIYYILGFLLAPNWELLMMIPVGTKMRWASKRQERIDPHIKLNLTCIWCLNKYCLVISTLVIILDIKPWIAKHMKSPIYIRRIHPSSIRITGRLIPDIGTLLIFLRWKFWEGIQIKITITNIKDSIKWHSWDIVIYVACLVTTLFIVEPKERSKFEKQTRHKHFKR